MYFEDSFAAASSPAYKILVIDEDASTAETIAAVLGGGSCEIIACRDMALAEAATDLTEFDLILVAPGATGVDGAEGLAVADFLAARNPTAVTALMVPRADGDLKAAIERTGAFAVLDKPLMLDEFARFTSELGVHVAEAPITVAATA